LASSISEAMIIGIGVTVSVSSYSLTGSQKGEKIIAIPKGYLVQWLFSIQRVIIEGKYSNRISIKHVLSELI
jgi:hypothetical protein